MKINPVVIAIALLLFLGIGALVGSRFLSGNPPATPAVSTPSPAEQTLVQIDTPKQNTLVTSPLTVSGRARGTWYSEGSFPVRLVDQQGQVIARGVAQAQGEWMTTEWVPFTATLTFGALPAGSSRDGVLILERDNPSGLPEQAQEVRHPIKFSL